MKFKAFQVLAWIATFIMVIAITIVKDKTMNVVCDYYHKG
jgi:hypothetical protein